MVTSSVKAFLLSTGQVLCVLIIYFVTGSPFPHTIELNRTVAGFCDISEGTARLLNLQRTIDLGLIQIPIGDWRDYDLLLANWERTLKPVLDWYES